MIVRFPDYRSHEEARIQANDAMMALLVASRVAAEVLRTNEDQDVVQIAGDVEWLPRLFPTVREMRRLNIRRLDAAAMIEAAASQLVQMSIPFALSIHGAYVARCLGHLQRAGVDQSGTDPSTIRLKDLHGHFSDHGGGALSGVLIEMFNLSRMMRNRIIHHGGTTGHELRPAWRRLSRRAKASWVRLADREPAFGQARDPLALEPNELIAVLAITKNLASTLCALGRGRKTPSCVCVWGCIQAPRCHATAITPPSPSITQLGWRPPPTADKSSSDTAP